MGSLLSVPASSGSSFESDPRRAAKSFPAISDDSEQSPLLDPPPISSEAEYGDTDDDNDEVIEDFIKADRDTKLFGNTPEAVEEYKQWAAKHVPVAKLPNACHPPSHTSETYDAPIAGRPLLHYGIGFKADELVRVAEKHQKLSAETRPVMFGMFSAKALARYLGIRPGVELAVVRPLSVDYA
ncbi:hypothetical protein K466DRAFT_348448 [Polyporus arcularius HHB13444]|uniref:Uncharacterized protein n=1 Tax=Polyporus arcularius HHB13444 TaxID=1314778 RepID=A0A5C3PPP8_9APHY|nr:hypothetical protein K466DRAFT_348448 [Polyporus arcularius HHB13444]